MAFCISSTQVSMIDPLIAILCHLCSYFNYSNNFWWFRKNRLHFQHSDNILDSWDIQFNPYPKSETRLVIERKRKGDKSGRSRSMKLTLIRHWSSSFNLSFPYSQLFFYFSIYMKLLTKLDGFCFIFWHTSLSISNSI